MYSTAGDITAKKFADVGYAFRKSKNWGNSVKQPKDADEKERIASWNKRCAKVWFRYLVFVVLTFALLIVPFIQVFHYFMDVTVPLVSGELTYGQPGYQEYQAAKDRYLIILAALLVLFSVVYYFGHRWYKRAIRALGTPPSGMFNRWNRWVVGSAQES